MNVKIEEEEMGAEEAEEAKEADPLSQMGSPSAMEATPKNESMEVETPETATTRGGGRWMRLKRPLRELLARIMGELRRKDEVGVSEPPWLPSHSILYLS